MSLEHKQVSRIVGGRVYANGAFEDCDVAIEGELFARMRAGMCAELSAETNPDPCDGAACDARVVDASGCYVIPGLIDLHFHGCMGADVSDGDAGGLHTMARYEASRGVTAICPATMTLPEETLTRALATAAGFEAAGDEAALVGINLEGPYISPDKVGAQNPAYVRPADAEEFARLQEAAGGLVKLIDVAPETPGALAFIEKVASRVRVSLAHTCADYACAAEAFEHGARHVTHLYNAMPALHHRKPGPIAAAAEHDDVTAELIADGVHVHPAMVRLAFELFGANRIVLISDSLRACGLADGTYDLGGQSVTVRGSQATLADGTLAGSVCDLATCLATCVREMGIPLDDAVRAATENPARALGVWGERGSIEAGKVADAVVLDENLQVRHVVLRGQLLF